MLSKATHPDTTVLADNRRARFEYDVLERVEAGIALTGSEVKSIRAGKVSVKEAYAQFSGTELFLLQVHVAEYVQAHTRNHEPLRKRKLLLHRRELDRLRQAVTLDGLTLIPLCIYLKHGRVKVELGLCRGKKLHDKRATIKQREHRREVERAIREQG